jgi:G protein-coupled receptor Mth (Methuselah protein)
MLHHKDEEPPMFPPDDFCVDKHAALVCNAPIVEGIRKCCGQNAAYSEAESSCVHTTQFPSTDALHSAAHATGFPLCASSGMYFIAGELDSVNFTENLNGTSLQLAAPPAPPLPRDAFCLERVLERPNLVAVLTCAEPQVTNKDVRFTLYACGLAVSAFFLAATLATSFLLPKTHHALHWRCQTCHVACLLVADVLLAFVQFAGRNVPEEACVVIGEYFHFFFQFL